MTIPERREFTLIERCFRPLAGAGALDLTDDVAVLAPPAGRELVLSADAMIEGVHFLASDPPELIARKILRVNLSDLAAKGADPLGYLLTLAAPKETEDAWFTSFAAGLARDQDAFNCRLLGGDTVSTAGPVSLSLTIIGSVESGRALLRRGAKAGDGIWVSGTIGDAALGLAVLKGEIADPTGELVRRYHLPEPRVGLPLADIAHAGMDISDGLVQDLGHLCRVNGIAAEVDAALVPLSSAARALGDAWLPRCLTGGDDYELLLAVPDAAVDRLKIAAERIGTAFTHVGRFVAGSAAVRVCGRNGAEMRFKEPGWSHF